MAITIVTSPGTLVAALRPVTFTATSDREASTAFTGITADNNGGFNRFTLGAHSLKVGDVVTPTLYKEYINVRQTITAVTATEITTDLVWSAGGDLTGTVTRTNDDFKIKVEVSINGTYNDSAVYRYSQSGTFTINIEKFLQSYLKYKIMAIGASTVIQGTLPDNMITFIIKCNEYWNNAANVSTLTPTVADRDKVSSATTTAILASREHTETSGIATAYTLGTTNSKFLTKAVRRSGITNLNDIPVLGVKDNAYLSFFYDTTDDLKLIWRTCNEDDSVIATNSATAPIFNMSNKYATIPVNFTFITNPGAGKYVYLYVYNNTTAAIVSELFCFKVIDETKEPNYFPITFLNSFGAWDCFSFYYDLEDTVDTDQDSFEKSLGMTWVATDAGVETFYTKQKRRFKIKSKLVSTSVARWLEELQRSKKLIMFDGTNRFPLTNAKVTIPNIKKNDYQIQITLEADYPDVH